MEYFRVKIWGARGSLPAPLSPAAVEGRIRELFDEFFALGLRESKDVAAFLAGQPRHRLGGYGGDTPCVDVRAGSSQVIVDGGSGIRRLGYELLAGPCGKGQGEVHILFTHFHWDHLLGLPFFVPIFIPGNVVHVYSVQPELPEVFKTLFKKPFFPVPLDKLGARIEYHQLEPRKPVKFGELTATPYRLDHPDPCWGYRFDYRGKAYSHCVDTECVRVSREDLGPDLPLYQGVDLMVFDAQYTLMETMEKVNWGHAAASLGLEIAMREGVKRVAFMHHDPASSDEKVVAAEAQARQFYDSRIRAGGLHPVEWCFAHDGSEFTI